MIFYIFFFGLGINMPKLYLLPENFPLLCVVVTIFFTYYIGTSIYNIHIIYNTSRYKKTSEIPYFVIVDVGLSYNSIMITILLLF